MREPANQPRVTGKTETPPERHLLLSTPRDDAAQARRAGAALFRYAIAATSGDGARAEAFMREVSRLVPDVVASAARDSTAGDLADVRRTLGSLRGEQERLRQQLQSMEQRLQPTGGRR